MDAAREQRYLDDYRRGRRNAAVGVLSTTSHVTQAAAEILVYGTGVEVEPES